MNNEDLRLKNEEYTKAKLLPPARQELRFGDPSAAAPLHRTGDVKKTISMVFVRVLLCGIDGCNQDALDFEAVAEQGLSFRFRQILR